MCRVFGSALPAVFSCSVTVKVSAGPPAGCILMRRNSSIQSGMFSGDGCSEVQDLFPHPGQLQLHSKLLMDVVRRSSSLAPPRRRWLNPNPNPNQADAASA
ncbi:hypothetical protein ATANTOWER_001609 [Ataeniobius toweri]|uniref:Secreted protein n=1 Tax=Ataeniobius toweri TaxID=208326 RepID=A0ABU7BWU7_9TELE|nr:hypothetical protein [Ataeniobius toweri]